jgi:hypothetical protein
MIPALYSKRLLYNVFVFVTAMSVYLFITTAFAVPPTLYSTTNYQSPVGSDPDDLMIIPGYGFAADDIVVYKALSNSTVALTPPASVPTSNSVTQGVAPIASAQNIPDSLTIQLPTAIQKDQTYALWVRNKNGEWSNGIKINDARPIWITPDSGYATALSPAFASRYLKVVGRNLQPAPGAVTQVKLIGPSTFTLTAANDNDPSTAIEHYVASVTLPASMPVGSYTVQVSRDGVSWVPLSGQTFTVKTDPVEPAVFHVSSYGGCQANDNVDDALCILNAVNAAGAAGGGTVVFGPGVWNMDDSTTTGIYQWPNAGIVVPVGVNLKGAGAGVTTLIRGANWNPSIPDHWIANFVLLGKNTVQGFTFKDAHIYIPSDNGIQPILKLGRNSWWAQQGDPTIISDVIITHNVFDKPFMAIANGGQPIDHLIITYNEIGAYHDGLCILGGITDSLKFHMDNTIINYNTFKPGSYIDNAIYQGTIASRISSTRRSDFSNNTADGTSSEYLQFPSDPKGFRAGFFWTNTANSEMILTSKNSLICTGDKNGDGEAIAYDGTANPTFSKAQLILAAAPNTVKVQGPLPTTIDGLPTSRTLPTNYFNNDIWVQVVDGPGVGQMRHVISYTSDSSGITFTISPSWDVAPQTTSRLTIAHIYWQVYTIDNFVDNRSPRCLKSNQTNQEAGGITMWGGPAADSTFEGNKQYDSQGIYINQTYKAEDPDAPGYTGYTVSQYFIEIRGNSIDHEYNWDSDASWSGIFPFFGASPTPNAPPPVMGYGISIARNTIIHADGLRGGAISEALSWYAGPSPNNWKLVKNTLIYHNTIQDLSGPPPTGGADWTQTTRVGIHLTSPLVWNTVLYANTFNNVTTQLVDQGIGTITYTPADTQPPTISLPTNLRILP